MSIDEEILQAFEESTESFHNEMAFFAAGYRAALGKLEWRKPEEELPEVHIRCLLVARGGQDNAETVDVGWLEESGNWYFRSALSQDYWKVWKWARIRLPED